MEMVKWYRNGTEMIHIQKIEYPQSIGITGLAG